MTPNLINLGPIISTATRERQIFARDSQGQVHLLFNYVAQPTWANKYQQVDINLATGEVRLTEAVLGRPSPHGFIQDRDNPDIIYSGSGDPGHLYAYDLASGVLTYIGPTVDRDAYHFCQGPDGMVWIGGYHRGILEGYNPQTGERSSFDLVDDPAQITYLYTVGADHCFVYAAVRSVVAPNNWWLVVLNPYTGAKEVLWQDLALTNVTIEPGTDGYWYAARTGPDSKRFRLACGAVTEFAGVHTVDWARLPLNYQEWLTAWRDSYGYEVDMAQADPYNDGQAVVRWRQTGTVEWLEAQISGIRVSPIEIKRLIPWGDSRKFLGISTFYGPVFTREHDTGEVKVVGRPALSIYGLLRDCQNAVFTGYAAISQYWDTELPGFSLQTIPVPAAYNGKYHYFPRRDAYGFVWCGVHEERDDVGGSLWWYNHASGETGGLKAPFETHDFSELVAIKGGTQMAAVVFGVAGQDGKLVVMDAGMKQVLREIAPIPGQTDLGKAVEVAPGVLLGVSKTNNLVWRVNLDTGAVEYSATLPGLPFNGQKYSNVDLVKGADGWAWCYLGVDLYRINPADGTAARMLANCGPAGNLLWFGGKLYVFGNGSADLRCIEGLM